jgi:predicted kinase
MKGCIVKDIVTKNYKNAQVKKEIILLRGLMGSGKSTLAKQLAGKTGISFSSDDFFMEEGQYNFDVSKIKDAHEWNYNRAMKAIDQGLSPVILDNTNVDMKDLKLLKPLVQYAIQHGYEPRIEEAKTPWAFNAEELAKRNKHGVPLDAIQEKLKNWAPNPTIQDILADDGNELV